MYPFNWPFSMLFASLGLPLLIKVDVVFDAEANVYVATSPNVDGLVVEASTLDEVRKEVELALPELLSMNHMQDSMHAHKETHLQFNTQLKLA